MQLAPSPRPMPLSEGLLCLLGPVGRKEIIRCPPSLWGRGQLECLGLLGCPGPGIERLGRSQALGAFAPLPTSPGLLLATELDVGAEVAVYKCTPGCDNPGTWTGAEIPEGSWGGEWRGWGGFNVSLPSTAARPSPTPAPGEL